MRHCIVERSRGRKSRGTHITKSTGGRKVVKREMPGLESAKSIEWSLEIERWSSLKSDSKEWECAVMVDPRVWGLDRDLVFGCHHRWCLKFSLKYSGEWSTNHKIIVLSMSGFSVVMLLSMFCTFYCKQVIIFRFSIYWIWNSVFSVQTVPNKKKPTDGGGWHRACAKTKIRIKRCSCCALWYFSWHDASPE